MARKTNQAKKSKRERKQERLLANPVLRAEIERRAMIQEARAQYNEQMENFRVNGSHVNLALNKIGITRAPKVSERVCVAGWRTNEELTPFMREIGNVITTYHGTHEYNIRSITRQSLSVSKSRDSCLYGKGIYTSPSVDKAKNYGCFSWNCRQFILVVKVALGNPLKNPGWAKYSWESLSAQGFHSVFAGAGVVLEGVWGGYLRNSECVVYRNDQAIISEIYEYAVMPQEPVYSAIKAPIMEPVKINVKFHVCRRGGKICQHARENECVSSLGKGHYRKNPSKCPFYSVKKEK